MANFRRALFLLAIMIGLDALSSVELFGQMMGAYRPPQDESTRLTKTRLTKQSSAISGLGERLSDPNLYHHRGYVAATGYVTATFRGPSTRLVYFLWVRHNGLEQSGLQEAIQAEDCYVAKLGSISRLMIRSEEFTETILLSRRETRQQRLEIVAGGAQLNASEPVYLHLDLTEENPQLRRISPTWDNADKHPMTHEALAELFAVIDQLQDSDRLVMEDMPPGGDEEDEFAAEVKRGFKEFFD